MDCQVFRPIFQLQFFLTAPASSLFRVLMRGTHECWCGTGFSQREMRPHTHTHTPFQTHQQESDHSNTRTRERLVPQKEGRRSTRRTNDDEDTREERGIQLALRGCEICGASSRLLVVLQFRPISYTPIQCPFISGFWFNTPKTAERPWCEKLHPIPPTAPVGRGYSGAIGNSVGDYYFFTVLRACAPTARMSAFMGKGTRNLQPSLR